MLRHVRNLALIAIAVVGTAGGSARADFITYSHTTAMSATPFTDAFTLTAFDPSLGTLTGVTITQVAAITANVIVFNNTANSYMFSNAMAQVPVTVLAPDGSTVAVTATAVVASGTANPGFTFFPNVTGSMQMTSSIAASHFAAFEGAGTPLIFTAGFGGAQYSGMTPPGTPGAALFFGGSSTAGGTTTITYTYTPSAAAVPEPASLGLLGCGIVGVGMLTRRRRTA